MRDVCRLLISPFAAPSTPRHELDRTRRVFDVLPTCCPDHRHHKRPSTTTSPTSSLSLSPSRYHAPASDIHIHHHIAAAYWNNHLWFRPPFVYHSEIMTMQKGDILGHEFMGIVDKVGPGVTNIKVGQRVVASFQVACGDCYYCKQKLSSFCDKTNNSSLQRAMYGQADAGFFGYSHFTRGLARRTGRICSRAQRRCQSSSHPRRHPRRESALSLGYPSHQLPYSNRHRCEGRRRCWHMGTWAKWDVRCSMVSNERCQSRHRYRPSSRASALCSRETGNQQGQRLNIRM
ncbi:hypothetical protein BJ912DRAFT_7010 [Pholiota molesta]|nr:hypothetical protein BJ912DRAFT_7010 [Pholiota molesta]